MSKSKYCPETVDIVCQAIKKHGSDRAGYQAAKVHRSTFYKWLKDYPEFAIAVEAAKEYYRDRSPVILTEQAQKAFADYLFGRVVDVWTMEKSLYRRVKNKEESLKQNKAVYEEVLIEREVNRREIKRGIPKWAIERQLGCHDWADAIRVLVGSRILNPQAAQEIQELLGNNIVNSIQQIISNNALQIDGNDGFSTFLDQQDLN